MFQNRKNQENTIQETPKVWTFIPTLAEKDIMQCFYCKSMGHLVKFCRLGKRLEKNIQNNIEE